MKRVARKAQVLEKNKAKPLGSEILLSAKTSNDEHDTLPGSLDTGFSKSLVKREEMQTAKDVVATVGKREKWKAKARAFETKESASAHNMKLPQFAKLRKFEIGKLRLYGDLDEYHSIIVGRNAYQKRGLYMLSSTQ